MSKNNIVVITTRWMSVIDDEEGQKCPIHCCTDSRFTKTDISKLDKVSDYLDSHRTDHFWTGIPNDMFYSLKEDCGENLYKVYILPCLAKYGSDPDAWIQALVNQFSESGDVLRMMIHRSDLKMDAQVISSFQVIEDRDLKIRVFGHGSDVASLILLCDAYKNTGITASNIFNYVSSICSNISDVKNRFRDTWWGFLDGDFKLEDLCLAYNNFLSAVEFDVRGFSLPTKEKFKELAEGINDTPDNYDYIEQIIQKF